MKTHGLECCCSSRGVAGRSLGIKPVLDKYQPEWRRRASYFKWLSMEPNLTPQRYSVLPNPIRIRSESVPRSDGWETGACFMVHWRDQGLIGWTWGGESHVFGARSRVSSSVVRRPLGRRMMHWRSAFNSLHCRFQRSCILFEGRPPRSGGVEGCLGSCVCLVSAKDEDDEFPRPMPCLKGLGFIHPSSAEGEDDGWGAWQAPCSEAVLARASNLG